MVFSAVLAGLWYYPTFQIELALGLACYAAFGAWRPSLMLFLLPLGLALVNLAPWSGSLFLEEFDLVLATTLGVLLGRGLYATRIRLTFGQWLFLGLLTLSYGVSIIKGLLPLPPLDPTELSSYYSNWNAMRLGKAYLWALMLLPGCVALLRQDQKLARSSFAWGLAMACGSLGIVAMWERGAFQALSEGRGVYAVLGSIGDFSTPYRVTGLFSEMHTGGEAIDGFLALAWPFALLVATTARRRLGVILGSLALMGVFYASVTTFSRATYIALAAGLLGASLLFLATRKRDARANIGGLFLPMLLTGVTVTGTAYIFTRGGVLSLLAGLSAWGGGLLLAYFSTRANRRVIPGLLALPVAAGMCWVMARGMLTSKWVDNDWSSAWSWSAALTFLAMVAGGWLGSRLHRIAGPKGMVVLLGLVLGGASIATPALLGARMEARLASTFQDMTTRQSHWRTALEIMPDDIGTILFGTGVGRFPATYLWSQPAGQVGSYNMVREGKNIHLSLGGSQDLHFTQRVGLPAHNKYTLTMDARTRDEELNLRVRVGRRHIILPTDWIGSVPTLDTHIRDTQGEWQKITWTFELGDLGEGDGFGRLPLMLEIMNLRMYAFMERPATVLDIDNVSLKDSSGKEYIYNGDFSAGLARWFPYFDFNHLPWHIKNIWVKIYFDQGLLGLVSFSGFLAVVGFAALRRAKQGDAWGLAMATAMISFVTVGMFGGLVDMPRIGFLFYLIMLFMALSGPIRKSRIPRSYNAPLRKVNIDTNTTIAR